MRKTIPLPLSMTVWCRQGKLLPSHCDQQRARSETQSFQLTDCGYKNILSGHRYFMHQKKIDEYRQMVEMIIIMGKPKNLEKNFLECHCVTT